VAANGFLYPQIAELANVVDIMGRGILFADAITTVSERYAQEILTPTFGEKLDHLLRSRRDRLFGILNGIDYQEMNPATDRYISAQFDAHSLDRRAQNKRALQERAHLPVQPDTPLLAMISRLTDQKGFDLLAQIAQPLLAQGVQFIVLGIGDQHYHQLFQNLAARYPEQVAVFLTFNTELAQCIYAGSDMFLMPSRFEPATAACRLSTALEGWPIPFRSTTRAAARAMASPSPTMTPGSCSRPSCVPWNSTASQTSGVRCSSAAWLLITRGMPPQ